MVATHVFRAFALCAAAPFALGCGGATKPDEPVKVSAGSQTSEGGTSFGGSTAGGTAGRANGGSTAGNNSGGSGGVGEAGAASIFGECTRDADCVVLGDCCGCQAVPVGSTSKCPLDCAADRCLDLAEAPEARCVFGQCVLNASCSFPPLEPVLCGQKPSCPSGQVPSAPAGCYGPCIAATECLQVTSCADCVAPEQVCLFEQGVTGIAHCVEKPASCASAPSCACMGEACEGLACTEIENGIRCGNG